MSFASTSRAATATPYYRSTYTNQSNVTRAPNVRDDYERWYTEPVPSNRMALSLQSEISDEVDWALDRILRLCANEVFVLRSTPGIIDGLFVAPEWYYTEGHKKFNSKNTLFAVSRTLDLKRRHAIVSMFILRNCALNEHDCQELVRHSHSMPLMIKSLQNLDAKRDENTEFLLHCMEFLHSVATHYDTHALATLATQVNTPLQHIAAECSNRPSIISALRALSLLLGNPQNAHLLSPTAPALTASIRYLPLFIDKDLVDMCVNYLYVHLSHHVMSKYFMLHPDMPAVLRLLVTLLISEQVEDNATLDISGDVRSTPSLALVTIKDHDLTQEEFEKLLPMPEPQRCYEWMKIMFIAKPDGELTQVDFWTFYKDVFTPHGDRYPHLPASEVIKNVNLVFPEAQAMVLQDPVQRFIVRGVARRVDTLAAERLKCRWDKGQCPAAVFPSITELFEHVLEHITGVDAPESPCLWATCSRSAMSKVNLRAHVLTHLSRKNLPERDPSQSDTITVSKGSALGYPTTSPTVRLPPPPRNTTVTYPIPVTEPTTVSLTALLCIRILFRNAFTTTEEAPRADEEHFGFPGVVEEPDESEDPAIETAEVKEREKEGSRKGRKAFVGVRKLMERVQIRDEPLMCWISEMLDAALTGDMLES